MGGWGVSGSGRPTTAGATRPWVSDTRSREDDPLLHSYPYNFRSRTHWMLAGVAVAYLFASTSVGERKALNLVAVGSSPTFGGILKIPNVTKHYAQVPKQRAPLFFAGATHPNEPRAPPSNTKLRAGRAQCPAADPFFFSSNHNWETSPRSSFSFFCSPQRPLEICLFFFFSFSARRLHLAVGRVRNSRSPHLRKNGATRQRRDLLLSCALGGRRATRARRLRAPPSAPPPPPLRPPTPPSPTRGNLEPRLRHVGARARARARRWRRRRAVVVAPARPHQPAALRSPHGPVRRGQGGRSGGGGGRVGGGERGGLPQHGRRLHLQVRRPRGARRRRSAGPPDPNAIYKVTFQGARASARPSSARGTPTSWTRPSGGHRLAVHVQGAARARARPRPASARAGAASPRPSPLADSAPRAHPPPTHPPTQQTTNKQTTRQASAARAWAAS